MYYPGRWLPSATGNPSLPEADRRHRRIDRWRDLHINSPHCLWDPPSNHFPVTQIDWVNPWKVQLLYYGVVCPFPPFGNITGNINNFIGNELWTCTCVLNSFSPYIRYYFIWKNSICVCVKSFSCMYSIIKKQHLAQEGEVGVADVERHRDEMSSVMWFQSIDKIHRHLFHFVYFSCKRKIIANTSVHSNK